MAIINAPYTTSNKLIAYPFREDNKNISYSGEFIHSYNKADTRIPSDMFLDAYVLIDYDNDIDPNLPIRLAGYSYGGSDEIRLYFSYNNDTGISYQLTHRLCEDNWLRPIYNNVNSNYPFLSFFLLNDLDIKDSRWFSDISISSRCLFFQPKRVKSINIKDSRYPDTNLLTIGGSLLPEVPELKLKALGYNTVTENTDDGIRISAEAGSGNGIVPCSSVLLPYIDDIPIYSINGVQPDSEGNVNLTGDDCIDVAEYTDDDSHIGLQLTSICAPCCDCEDYYKVLESIHARFKKEPKLLVEGFSAVSLNGVYTYTESDGKWHCDTGATLYKIDASPDGYYRWKLSFGNSSFYSLTNNSEYPIGCAWVSKEIDDLESVVSATREESEVRIYKDNDIYKDLVSGKVSIHKETPSGIQALDSISRDLYYRNRESYQHASYFWNSKMKDMNNNFRVSFYSRSDMTSNVTVSYTQMAESPYSAIWLKLDAITDYADFDISSESLKYSKDSFTTYSNNSIVSMLDYDSRSFISYDAELTKTTGVAGNVDRPWGFTVKGVTIGGLRDCAEHIQLIAKDTNMKLYSNGTVFTDGGSTTLTINGSIWTLNVDGTEYTKNAISADGNAVGPPWGPYIDTNDNIVYTIEVYDDIKYFKRVIKEI